MKIGTEDKKKLIAVSVLGPCALIAIFFLYEQLFGGPSTPPPVRPVVAVTPTVASTSAKTTTVAAAPGYAAVGTGTKLATTGGQLDPTLHMEAMLVTESLVYSGSGRNIFGMGPADEPPPVKLEKAGFKARPDQPPPPVQRGPQIAGPPPINMKFFGTATSLNGTRRAFLLNGDDVILASVGDVVQRRYRVVSISATSILVEDIPNSNKQTLPLIPQ